MDNRRDPGLRIWHWALGLHSNIPVCCIRYFVRDWDNAFLFWRAGKSRDPMGPRYIRCDDCLRSNRRSHLHECSIACSKNFREFYLGLLEGSDAHAAR